MRILYLSQLIPYPADAGPKVRIYHVLQYLAQAGHDITFVAFQRESDSAEQLSILRQYCSEVLTIPMRRSRALDGWHLLRSLVTGHPFLISRDSVRAMHRQVERVVARHPFDGVHADQLWMAQYALAAKEKSRNKEHVRLTLDQHNAVYLIPQRLAASTANPMRRALLSREARNLARYEAEVCQRFDNVIWVSEEDQRALADVATGATSLTHETVIPICVDPEEKTVIPRHPGARRVTFLGGLHWPPNREGVSWFATEVWPQVLEKVPDAVLTIIGKDAPPATHHALSSGNNIEITGYVADPTPYLRETAVFIVPLHAGGGMRVKILDAWAWGLPIVSTSVGAEGTTYQDQENMLVADSATTFGAAVSRLLSHPELACEIGLAGRKTVETYYDWRTTYQAWDKIYGLVNKCNTI